MTGTEAQLRDQAFREYMLDNWSFENSVAVNRTPPAFVRHGFFDVAAHECWLDRRYQEWKR